MRPLTRKIWYLTLMPLLFFINIMISISWIDTTGFLLVVLGCTVVLWISDRGKVLTNLNEWVKRKALFAFPDIYQTGVMPNGRALLICIPCIVSIILNIPLGRLR